MELERLGTDYGGWVLPKFCDLNENSIIYCVGVGEDISFDLLLFNKYKSNMVLIDPTNRAKIYFEKVKKYFNDGLYKEELNNTYLKEFNFPVDFSKFNYIDKGLWDIETELKFYKQSNPNYVSQTFIENMYTDVYDIVQTTTLTKVMNNLSHKHIDLIKMDIEGSEITVIEYMLANNILPKYILVEFDLKDKGKDNNGLTEKIISKLEQVGYFIYNIDRANVCFMKK